MATTPKHLNNLFKQGKQQYRNEPLKRIEGNQFTPFCPVRPSIEGEILPINHSSASRHSQPNRMSAKNILLKALSAADTKD